MRRARRKRPLAAALSIGALLAMACGGASERLPGDSAGDGGATAVEADTCASLEGDYAAAFDAATSCSPDGPDTECTALLGDGLACGCPTFVNPGNTAALERATAAASAFRSRDCSKGMLCGPCQSAIRGRCSAAGRCENVYGEPRSGQPWAD